MDPALNLSGPKFIVIAAGHEGPHLSLYMLSLWCIGAVHGSQYK